MPLDSTTADALASVLWSGIASLLVEGVMYLANLPARRAEERKAHQKAIRDKVENFAPLERVLSAELKKVGSKLRSQSINQERLQVFLLSDGFGVFFGQLMQAVLEFGGEDDFSKYRKELAEIVRINLGVPRPEAGGVAGDLLPLLRSASASAYRSAIDSNVLAAHELAARARNATTHAKLDSIAHATGATPDLSLAELERFEEAYRSQCLVRWKHVTPPYFSSRSRVVIDDLYVVPDISPLNPNTSHQNRQGAIPAQFSARRDSTGVSRYAHMVRSGSRVVILGDPGAGKSTFAQKISYDICGNHSPELTGGAPRVPMFVEVKRYFKARSQESALTVRDYLISSTAEVQLAADHQTVDFWLSTGRAVIVFDGLDEVLDVNDRSAARDAIELFASEYPLVSILVTSRVIGYSEAPLAPEFIVRYVKPFSNPQIGEYAEKWFKVVSDNNSDDSFTVSGFLSEVNGVEPQLRENPLLLGLICNTYRGDGYIPRNQADLYEKCARMLFETLDKRKKLDLPFSFEEHMAPVLSAVAHSVYEDSRDTDSVPEYVLHERVTTYLSAYFEPETAPRTAKKFVEFCIGRAWVFTDVGFEGDERVFKFTHRSFLEYFTALHFVRNNPEPSQLADRLLERVSRGESVVVAHLAFQILNRQSEAAGEQLASALASGIDKGLERLSLFLAEALAYLRISPETVRTSVDRALAYCSSHRERRTNDSTSPPPGQTVLTGMYLAHQDRLRYVDDAVARWSSTAITIGPASSHFSFAADIWAAGPTLLTTSHASLLGYRIAGKLRDGAAQTTTPHAVGQPKLAATAAVTGLIPFAELVELHGLNVLATRFYSPYFERTTPSVMEYAASAVLGEIQDHSLRAGRDLSFEGLYGSLHGVDSQFISLPDIRRAGGSPGTIESLSASLDSRWVADPAEFSEGDLYCVLIAMLVLWELHLATYGTYQYWRHVRPEARVKNLSWIGKILGSRVEPRWEASASATLQNAPLSAEDRSVLLSWVAGRTSFVLGHW